MHVPRPRPPARNPQVRVSALALVLVRNLPGDSDAGAPRKFQKFSLRILWGPWACGSLSRASGRGEERPAARPRALHSRCPVAVRRRRPRARGQRRSRLLTPASISRQVWARSRPGPAARGNGSGRGRPAGPYRSGGHGGNSQLRVPAGEGNGEREGVGWEGGDRAAPGTVCPERQRLPVTTTTAAQSNPALQAWPDEPRDSVRSGDCGAPVARQAAQGSKSATTHTKANVY